jgi:hypothetical protein
MLALDDGDLLAQLRGPDRRHVSAGPGPDHHHVETAASHATLLRSLLVRL